MKNVNKVCVTLSLPHGAHFYKNIYSSVYRQLLQFIYRMNCLAPRKRCEACSLSKNCRYYYYTGENFRYYPSILIVGNFFPKSIYQKGECISFNFYLIGEGIYFLDYIKIFFEHYLQHTLVKAYFDIIDITVTKMEEHLKQQSILRVANVLENTDFFHIYNAMVEYYDRYYHCTFEKITPCTYTITHYKRVYLDGIRLRTANVLLNGITCMLKFEKDINISSLFLETGIGRYNIIGGGKFEN